MPLKHNKLGFFILLLILLLISMTGCSSEFISDDPALPTLFVENQPSTTPLGVLEVVPSFGGVMKMGVVGINELNPLRSINSEYNACMKLVYDTLVKVDGNQNILPSLATAWTEENAGVTWTITINSGVLWHDGSALTAADVKATIEWIRDHGGTYGASADNVYSCSVKDDTTIVVNLNKTDYMFPYKLTFPILKKSTLNSGNFTFIGSGLYEVSSNNDQQITLICNQKYWGKAANIAQVNIIKYSSERERMAADDDLLLLLNEDVDNYVGKTNYAVYPFTSDNLYSMVPMCGNSNKFGNVNFRRAVFSCLDKEKIIEAAALGCGYDTDWPLPSFYQKSLAVDDSDSNSSYNLEEAKKYMVAAGFVFNNDSGKWTRADNSVVIYHFCVPADDSELRAIAEEVGNQLSDFGLIIEIYYFDQAEFEHIYSTHQCDLAFFKFSCDYWTQISKLFKTYGSINHGQYSNTEIDNLMDQIEGVKYQTLTEMIPLFTRINEIIDDEVPFYGLYKRENAVMINSNIKLGQVEDLYSSNPFANFAKWYIESTVAYK